ncbi:glutaredoxin 3 [Aureimonas jatrophae]|jgi:glutaredoxin 3|uniref:Glutaredoxin n=1 Tax=Aureimonas jatrophae TaxID=1166073 RepID=A0A1H0I914_9HYPH|nr:glutaredoxin 3 [Aureimonas jatrophae]MBB3952048.1 glutaredoxin 3 [Aureimonas jatrophae]SDO27882.1 glutaredoxin 3 [Aureimonas jatrophae]
MPPVVIYTRPACGYCSHAKALLRSKGVEFEEKDAGVDPSFRGEMLARANGRTTFPQIFIGERHVGGCDDLVALDRSGGLDPLLAA